MDMPKPKKLKLNDSVIAGGLSDTIIGLDSRWVDTATLPFHYLAPIMSAIGGGDSHTVNGNYGTVTGGYQNHALGIGSLASGVGNEALDYQTVVGHYNANVPDSQQLHNLQTVNPFVVAPLGDEATFVVGNGTGPFPGQRSNAFTVSDNGHTTVTQNLPTGDSTIFGSTYADNTIIAWGDVNGKNSVNAGGGLTSGIGDTVIGSVFPQGEYQIVLHVKDPNGSPHNFANGNAAIVVTPGQAPTGFATVSVDPLVWSGGTASFMVYTYESGVLHNEIGFQFHVVSQ
jgi:hypothetical protein